MPILVICITQTDLLQVVGGIDARFDFALVIQIQHCSHGLRDELGLRIQVAQVETAHGAIALDQTERVNRELLVPGLSHGEQVLLLAR